MKPRNKKAARVETEAARNQTSEASLPQQSSHVKGNGNGHLSDALARAKLLELLAKVGSKSVTFNRAYAELGAGIPGAILITQCVFWSQCKSNSSRKGYFYKTLEDWTDETALSRYQIESARRFFVENKVLKHRVFGGIPPKSHYRVNFSALLDLLIAVSTRQAAGPSNMRETRKCEKLANQSARNSQRNADPTFRRDDDDMGSRVKVSSLNWGPKARKSEFLKLADAFGVDRKAAEDAFKFLVRSGWRVDWPVKYLKSCAENDPKRTTTKNTGRVAQVKGGSQ